MSYKVRRRSQRFFIIEGYPIILEEGHFARSGGGLGIDLAAFEGHGFGRLQLRKGLTSDLTSKGFTYDIME